MGVDASYLYGYGANVEDLEWDIDYLKEKYKDKLHEKINPENEWKPTWYEFIANLEQIIEDEDSESLAEHLSDANNLFNVNWDDESYLTFDHTHLAQMYPDAKLKDLDELAKLYAKELGIKNPEVIEWIEWGYFS